MHTPIKNGKNKAEKSVEKKKIYRCEQSLKTHTCYGPLYEVLDGKNIRILCIKAIKNLMLSWHEMEIIKNVPRSDILE